LKPKELSAQERINWIRLARTQDVGPATFFRLLEVFDENINKTIEQTPDFSKAGGAKKFLTICEKNLVEKELENCQKYGAKILTFLDETYPRMLREIYDPAPILTVKGEEKLLNKDVIAIIGPRNASFHACKFAEKMANDLSCREIIIISGLAKGIDAAAHRGSLEMGTIAVIAGGINHVYPAENKFLFDEIAKKGVIISEQPFGAAPRGSNFIQRNRIISGISYGVVVVEAGMQSGSLATARFALDQGREVFAVPGFPADPRTHGSNLLIEEGAIFTLGSEKVLKEMCRLRSIFGEVGMFKEPETVPFKTITSKFPSDDDIKKIREEIDKRIGFLPLSIEEIITQTGASARLVNIALVQLELADKISIDFGKVVKK
ncbi:MAG TPA: DNA-processing protein DprA, partial [Rickettsiales bacterium]|nr:DNA-processing protein DprA [Rickettsiales bacterium]